MDVSTLTDVELLEAFLRAAADETQTAQVRRLAEEMESRGPERADEARRVVGQRREAARVEKQGDES